MTCRSNNNNKDDDDDDDDDKYQNGNHYDNVNHDSKRRRRYVFCIPYIITSLLVLKPTIPSSAETIGKDPNCQQINCLGVWDGLLADCPHSSLGLFNAGCTSSQDDTPGIFSEPWDYSEASNLDWVYQQSRLLPALEAVCSKRKDQLRIILQEGRYIRVFIRDGKSSELSVGEFYFTPQDTTVQFRLSSTASSSTSWIPSGGGRSLRNIDRAEEIRQQLGYTKIPVLRNRQRTLWFGESDWDTFGPSGSEAVLGGPIEEMSTSSSSSSLLDWN